MKVKMLARFGGQTGRKFERGLEYVLPPDYALELMAHGLAELVSEAAVAVPEPQAAEPEESIVEVERLVEIEITAPSEAEPPKSKGKSALRKK